MPNGAAPALVIAAPPAGTELREARASTDALFAAIRPEALRDRPVPERHRLIFYLGHLEAFDWNLLAPTLGLKPYRSDLDRLFAFGIDPVRGGLPDEPADAWPTEAEVRRYAGEARERLDARLADAGNVLRGTPLLDVAIEHRLMHAETLSYLLRELPASRKRPPLHELPRDGARPEARRVRVPAGLATLGRPRAQPGFGWDNEYDECVHPVPTFDIDVHDVTNDAFLRFVEAGGYDDRRLWTRDGWEWIRAQARWYPAGWRFADGAWRLRTTWGETDLPLAWPAEVSHTEASAYARWLGRGLPSEEQWHRAACGTPEGRERQYPWGDQPPDASRGHFGLRGWDCVPVGSHPAGASAFGVEDLVGNGWEWTSTPFAPLPGFKPFDFYRGYSQPFFDGDHFVLKGGGARTAERMLRRSFRNWFQPRYVHVAASFRTVGP